MEEQDFPIGHFESMARLATNLKAVPVQVLEHGYHYEAFGSWSLVVRCKGTPLRVVFDGREAEYRIERSTSRKNPYRWEQPVWRHASGSDSDGDRANLLTAIVRLSAAG
jgi:hypothetical protein